MPDVTPTQLAPAADFPVMPGNPAAGGPDTGFEQALAAQTQVPDSPADGPASLDAATDPAPGVAAEVAASGKDLPPHLPPELLSLLPTVPSETAIVSGAPATGPILPDDSTVPAGAGHSIASVLSPPPLIPARDGQSLSASTVALGALVSGADPASLPHGLNHNGTSPEGQGERNLPTPLLKVVNVESSSGPLSPAFALTAGAPPLSASGTAPPPVMQATVSVPLGQASWGQALGHQVVWAVQQNVSSAQLHLSPPELGPLSVRISLEQDQASINFTSAHALVRDAIEAALPRLRDMLGSQGITLADVNVQQHAFAHDGRGDAQSAAGSRHDDLAGPEAGPPVPPAAVAAGLVDLYA